jgi:heptaprenylglyceryl phosphate synthase
MMAKRMACSHSTREQARSSRQIHIFLLNLEKDIDSEVMADGSEEIVDKIEIGGTDYEMKHEQIINYSYNIKCLLKTILVPKTRLIP